MVLGVRRSVWALAGILLVLTMSPQLPDGDFRCDYVATVPAR